MKKSIYNKIINLKNGKTIAFNALTCALAEVEDDFFEILNNIENIEIEKSDIKTQDLIKQMQEGNFIVDDSLNELELVKYRNYAGKFNNENFGMVIAPTLACNFACPYCYESAKKGIMSEEIQEKLIEIIEKRAKLKKNIDITWYGGEPLLAKDLIFKFSKKIIEICKNEKVDYSAFIVTNGYLINEEVCEKFKEAKINGVQITVDGPPDIHNQRRILKNSKEPTFNKILENIKMIKNSGIKNITLRINIDKTNVDRVTELLDILEVEGLNKYVDINLGHVTAYTEACNSIVDTCLNVKEYSESDLKYSKILFERGYKVAGEYPYYPGVKGNYCCADHIDSFVIDPEGYMYKCWNDIGNYDLAVGNVLQLEETSDKMMSTNMKYMLWSPFEFKKCTECDILPICMGGCPNIGIKSKEPQCEKWKYSIEKNIISTYENSLKEDKKCEC